jgi:hypothetical protein
MDPENPAPQPSQTPDQKLSQIRTFQGDVANAIQKQNESIMSIQRAETARRPDLAASEERAGGHKALVYAVLTLVLVGLGGVGTYFAYSTYTESRVIPVVSTPENQFIGATVKDVDASTLSRQATIGVVAIERSKERPAADISQIQLRRGTTPTSELLSTADFFTRLNTHAPQPLVRALNPLFMLGVLGSNPSHTFLIIKVDSFENAFPGMLEWEPRIVEDLLPMFADDETTNRVPTAAAWRDLIVANRDTRVLRDTDGNVVLLYSFFGNSLLIMADNEATFRLIADRLESQKLER